MFMISRSAGALALALAAVPYSANAQLRPAEDALRIELAQAQGPAPRVRRPPASLDQQHKERINSWTVGLAAGRLEGAPIMLAAELARVLDDGDNMRVLPIVTRGPFDNVYDLLYLRGVDAAIVYGDVLDHFKGKAEFAGSWRRINYLLSLFPSEAHIFVRPEIKSLEDLRGKAVNFNTPGTAANFSGPIIFKQLGLDVKVMTIPHGVAMEKMRKGDEIAATFWISTKPLPQFKGTWPEGFRFLPIPYNDKLEYYAPTQLEHADYPNLIPQGQSVATVSVPAVLAVYDWPKETDRYKRLVRLVDYLFERFERLQKDPGYHKGWKDVNIAGTVPGWQRFRPLQDRLDQLATGPRAVDPALARSQAARAAPNDPAEQDRIFKQFLEWSGRQKQP